MFPREEGGFMILDNEVLYSLGLARRKEVKMNIRIHFLTIIFATDKSTSKTKRNR